MYVYVYVYVRMYKGSLTLSPDEVERNIENWK